MTTESELESYINDIEKRKMVIKIFNDNSESWKKEEKKFTQRKAEEERAKRRTQ